jgi:hypothetical protein
MTAVFKYIITEALFTSNAKLGSFIFNNDWMISTNGSPSGKTYYDFDPNGFKNYITSGTSYSGFIPNFAVDGKTGKTYQNDAYVKGTINATSGSITGNMNVGTDGNVLEIYANRSSGMPAFKRSGILGKNGNEDLLEIGFNQNKYPFLYLKAPSYRSAPQTSVFPGTVRLINNDSGGYLNITLDADDKIRIQAPPSCWPREGIDDISGLPSGTVYIRSDSCLGVKL